MPRPSTKPAEGAPAEQTRNALIIAALKLFGSVGYDGASTREIAAAAKANIGSIAYHFGGKDGLRMAVADHIVGLMQGVAARAIAQTQPEPPASAEQAAMQLQRMVEGMFQFIVGSPQGGLVIPFMLRELTTPTDVFDRVYAGVFEPMHKRFCGAWALATGDPADSEETKIAVFTLIGQVLYFRLAQEPVMRRMGWSKYGDHQVAVLTTVVTRNLMAAIQARRSARP